MQMWIYLSESFEVNHDRLFFKVAKWIDLRNVLTISL